MSRKVLFIDRDGTLILDPPPSYQVDTFEKLDFYPHVITYLGKIASQFDYELVMVTNQDGLGTDAFPEETFWPVQNMMLRIFENEGIHFKEVLIDKSFKEEHQPTRKPGTGLLTRYIDNADYDLEHSFVIGDRITDVMLAKNLGAKAFFLDSEKGLGAGEVSESVEDLKDTIAVHRASGKISMSI